jgi:hypothetical protein
MTRPPFKMPFVLLVVLLCTFFNLLFLHLSWNFNSVPLEKDLMALPPQGGTPTKKQAPQDISMQILLQQLEPTQNEQFDRSRPIFVDMGLNTGLDTLYHLEQDYSVVSVDAFTPHVVKFKSNFPPGHKHYSRLLVFNVGVSSIENEGTDMPFYFLRKGHPQASFNKEKACMGLPETRCHSTSVRVVTCQSILELIGQPVDFLKIDIEMMHFTCLQALHFLQPQLLPKTVCWEEHDKPFGSAQVPNPLTDIKLMLGLWELGYDGVKIIGQGPVAAELYNDWSIVGNGRWSPKMSVEKLKHLEPWTKDFDTEWKTMEHVMTRGIMPHHNLTGHAYAGLYFDICMKLSENATMLQDLRLQRENLPISERRSHFQ